jgi:hypothetical protein
MFIVVIISAYFEVEVVTGGEFVDPVVGAFPHFTPHPNTRAFAAVE